MRRGLMIVLAIALVGSGIWGYQQYQENMEHNIYLENQFQRMFYDMIVDVENIQVSLAKAMVTGTPKQNVMLFTDIMHLSYDAQEKLSQLPIDHSNVSKTQKFLSQVGDLSMSLARKNLDGKPLDQTETDTLEELHNYANYLSQQLIELQGQIANGGTRIGELARKANQQLKETNANMLTTSFVNMEEKMREYPELIYDGPFSEHLKRKKPRLQGKQINQNEIERIAESFVNDGTKYEANVLGDLNDTRMPAYVVSLKPRTGEANHDLTMAITKTGGKVIWMLDAGNIGEAKLSEEQGIQIAQAFLKNKGYQQMIPTYSVQYDGQMVINFAYQQNDIVIYPDLIKVKVGLDEGKIVGFEAEGFLSNNYERNIDPPKITAEEAREKISMAADVSEPRLAIIPTEGGSEILCYEFKAKYKQDTFLIYINADTGDEQKILQMIIKDEGVLML
ncbi:germination protein YpeB [Anaerosolibacter carboniphilus]|uniref:Germination protein YpeB n=1 Tax=Anaerosolibacter carboniphilus TaxID=1417629 RepID=A0A841KUS6_9FIRM|nr:germination protein YpeB [Anaerosolibacter carboniphilus]MBB6217123.1 germination protein YpeB [Anaerosolibacter carboniphilus]